MRILLPFVFLCVACAVSTAAATSALSSPEQKRLLRYLLPLPHEITIRKMITIPAGDIGIVIREKAAEIEKNAAEELRTLIRSKTGTEPNGKRFQIRIGVLDPSLDAKTVQRLKGLPNNTQAYVIRPGGDNLLVLSGLDGRGVYYAARTLGQLLEAGITGKQVAIPLAEVTDWPDLDERGLWNFNEEQVWIPWMASLKLNYAKMVNTRLQTVERGKPNHAEIDRELMFKARNMAFNYLPFILHLNFLHDFGLFQAYPELAGKGDSALAGRYFAHKQGNQHRCPCASNPLLATILAEWMADIAAQGAEETSCWLSERPCQCACPNCTGEGQFVWETRAFLTAWREVRKKYPDFRIRMFISTTDDDRYHKVLDELPPEVKIERACHAGLDRVRRLPRDILRNPLFDSYAAEGRWISSYDAPVSVNGLVETPEFKVPQRSAHRMRFFVRQIVQRKWQGAYGMLPWGKLGREVCGFDIAALAEWSWNLEGRTEREFAEAWAVREGFENPEAAGEWSELMGPVEADVYDSDFPTCYSWGKALRMVENRARPMLGEGMFRYYTGVDDFDRKAERCNQALEIARKAGYTELANESRVTLSYVLLARQIFLTAEQVSTKDLTSREVQNSLRRTLSDLEKAGKENVSAIRDWRGGLGPEPWHPRVHDALKGTEDTVRGITQNVTNKYLY
jgi:hypothetical protein